MIVAMEHPSGFKQEHVSGYSMAVASPTGVSSGTSSSKFFILLHSKFEYF